MVLQLNSVCDVCVCTEGLQMIQQQNKIEQVNNDTRTKLRIRTPPTAIKMYRAMKQKQNSEILVLLDQIWDRR